MSSLNDIQLRSLIMDDNEVWVKIDPKLVKMIEAIYTKLNCEEQSAEEASNE